MADLESALLENLVGEGRDWDGSAMLGDWVVVAEVFDESGEPYIASNATDGITFWKQLGMLEARIDHVRVNARG